MAYANILLVTFSDILTKNYNILHYHRRWYDKSFNRRNNSSSIIQHVEDCKKIIDLLNVKKDNMVGHSIGWTIALQLASHYPDPMYNKGQKNESIDILWKRQ